MFRNLCVRSGAKLGSSRLRNRHHLRAVSAAKDAHGDAVVWASGSHGVVIASNDQGKHFATVPFGPAPQMLDGRNERERI